MTTVATFARRAAAGLVAAQLLVGAVSVSALTIAAPAHAATLDEHGAWQGFTTTIDGKRLFGAITHIDNGAIAAFLIKDGGLSLFMSQSDWTFKVGTFMPVSVTIDGRVFTGSAIVRAKGLIEMPNVNEDVLRMFVDGAEAKLDVNQGDLVWTLDLDGFTASMADAVRLVKASY